MTELRRSPVRVAIAGILAATMLAGCTSASVNNRIANAASSGEAYKPARGLDRKVAAAETAVARSPQDAALRAALGQTYLDAGRFESAATTFEDAMELGDNSGGTALRLALAHIGANRNHDALALLDDWRDSIPKSDLGLALALAGEPGRGVATLESALRDGEATPKLRQNLAYAYALDGRWRDARRMAAQDVPADQIDARLGHWALTAQPEQSALRVASLLGAKLPAADPGQPQQLALAVPPAEQQLAAQTAGLAPEPAPVADALPSDGPAKPAIAVAAAAPAEPLPSPAFAQAFTGPVLKSEPVVQPLPKAAPVAPQRVAKAAPVTPVAQPAAPRAKARPAAAVAAVQPIRAAGTHLVQLGSFSSEQGARRAWGVFAAKNPELRNYRMTITPVVVRGQNYWRVAAAGLNGSGANGVCSAVKRRGGTCFAYASARPPVSDQPAAGTAGPMLARR